MRRNTWILINCVIYCLGAVLFVGCSSHKKPLQTLKLQPTTFTELPGWNDDYIGEVVPAFLHSCKIINKKKSHTPIGLGSVAGDWQPICTAALFLDTQNHDDVRSFFQESFTPYKVFADSNPRGLFTGYFESELKGSHKRTKRYQYPLHGLPPAKVSKFPSRKEILNGALDHHQCELIYVDDPVDAYFLHVQGSGRVYLEDGSVVRVGYAGQNGHSYSSLGQAIIDSDGLSREIVSMQSLRRWLKDNPKMAHELMNRNDSYIFFRKLEGGVNDGPIGAHGVPVTPRRSMAVDRRYIPMGVPLWLDIFHPENEINLRTLVIAQDTGGAIKGPVRGDFFWGHGAEAFHYAGMMKSRGQYYTLLPKTVHIPSDLLYNVPQT